jgi:hypothetical protein
MGIFDAINTNVLGNNTWPPHSRVRAWEEIDFLAALRTSDETALRMRASVPWNYPYTITPLPRMLSRASANMLFGEPAEFEPHEEDDADADRLDYIVTENGLDAENVRGALIASSEGEVYGRVRVDPSLLDCPIIEYISPRNVIPEFNGRFLTAATFVSEWRTGTTERVRRMERYTAGTIETTLWRGTTTSIGDQINLDGFAATAGTPPVIVTGFSKPLCCFIPNSIDSDPSRGFSDYRGLEQRFLELNEAAGIGAGNVRMTGRKRAVIDGDYLDQNGANVGRMRQNDDLMIAKRGDVMAGASGGGKPLSVLEYSFEADQLVQWIDHMINTSITFAGMSPQSVGRAVEGGAISGTAERLKQAFSLVESSGKGRHMDKGLGWLLRAAAVIDGRRTTEGGFGRKWNNPDATPTIARADPLPRDEMEAAQRLVLLTNAEAISTEEKVRVVNPDWSQPQIDEEVARINSASAPVLPSGPTPPAFGNPVTQDIPTLRPPIVLPN